MLTKDTTVTRLGSQPTSPTVLPFSEIDIRSKTTKQAAPSARIMSPLPVCQNLHGSLARNGLASAVERTVVAKLGFASTFSSGGV
jgi:hypothetical protein